MKIRKFMWFSLYVEIAAISMMFLLVLMQKTIPDYLMWLFGVFMFLCIGSSFFVRQLEVRRNKL